MKAPAILLLLSVSCITLYAQEKKDTVKTLRTVEIAARKPLVTRKTDRYIINIENSNLSNGFTALEVLQRSPGLWVSPNGNISISGTQSVTVMINDVLQRMSAQELADYLRTLRSEDISKIEVIPNPSAEYEASSAGGIVHIVLKKARQQGITGSVAAQYKQQGKDPYVYGGFSLDYKLKNWYVFGSYNYNKDKSRYTGYNNTTYPDGSHFYNDATRRNNNTRHQYRGGIVYDISATQVVNIQTNGNTNELAQQFHSAMRYEMTDKLVTGDAHTNWYRKPLFSSTTATYTWKTDTLGSLFKIIADYTRSSKEEINTLLSDYSDDAMDNGQRTTTPSTTAMYSAQADYTFLRGAGAGIKYVRTDRHNMITAEDSAGSSWIKNPDGSNDFRYKEDLLMFYGTYDRRFGRTGIKAGLRGEQTYAEGYSVTLNETVRRRYFGLFPSLLIDHTLDDKGNSVRLSYARKVRRPAYNDLNPYRLQLNDYSVLTGNPDLLPQYSHNIQAGYVFHNDYTADLYFKHTSNYIAQTASTIDDHVIEHKSKNYPRNTEVGLSLNAQVNILPNWRSNNGAMLYYTNSDFNDMQLSTTSLALKTMQMFEWKKVMDIDVYMEYNTPRITANAKMAQLFFADLGVARSILKKKGRLRLYATDLFNTFREKELTVYNGTRIDFYQKRPTRSVGISFSWSFNAGKVFAKKKIDANNTDEKSRM